MEMTGGQALAGQLVAEGVRDVFGIPGVQLDWATDALAGVADRIRYLIPRHEQAASYMADGYARASGREGVCMVVPGPGLLNAMTGLATAYACNSRVLCIAGQIPSPTIGAGLGMLHEVRNQSAILGAVTKWHALARRPEDVAPLVHEAFVQLRSGRPQPVGVEIPPDVLAARAEIQLLAAAPQAAPDAGDAALLDEAAAALRGARFPVIYAGGGALFAGAALRQLAETLQAPVVMSPNGRGALAHDHPLAASALAGRCLLPHADLVIVVGSRFIDGSGQPVHAHPRCRFVYVNLEAHDAGPPRRPGIALQADAGAALSALLARLEGFRAGESRADAVAKVRVWCDLQLDALQPQREYLDVLRRCLPADGVFVNELTQVGYVANLAFPVPGPRTFISPGYQGTLGYGFATAIGAALADPARPVISISGDGGFGWNLQELATVARYAPRLVTVVFEDGAFGNVRRIQSNLFKREIGTALHNPDFIALARAFGVDATAVDSPAGLEAALRAALDGGTPAVIVVRVGTMPSPWHLIHKFHKAPQPVAPNPLGEPQA